MATPTIEETLARIAKLETIVESLIDYIIKLDNDEAATILAPEARNIRTLAKARRQPEGTR